MTSQVVVTALIGACVAIGCTQKLTGVPATVPRVEVIETVETDADRLLDYYSYMSELQGDPLLREYKRVQRLFDEEANDRNRMQLIMLLSSQSATFRDTNAAKVLLEIWLDDRYNTYSKLRPLALLFDGYLTEVHRLDDAITRQAGMLGRMSERAARQAKELELEKNRTVALQKKLDALLEMEMNLIEREQITTPDAQ
jgi:hypothetical protein